jgi:urate oxidase
MGLSWNRHGKSGIRLVKVRRPEPGKDGDPHDIVDLTIDVQLEGAFDPVYVAGDNAGCLATDTMKNTVYAFARHDPIDHVESFALRLAEHFAGRPLVERVRIAATEQRWERLTIGGSLHPHAFVQPGGEQWSALVVRDAGGIPRVTAGVVDLVVLKTSSSSFSGFPRDEFTTLPETDDRLLATSVTASWTYRPETTDFSVRERIRSTLLETFAAHDSRSVQHTLYAMGEAALEAFPDISEITLVMPNRHHQLVDLTPFGLDNPNLVFVATDRPFGLIEATLRR